MRNRKVFAALAIVVGLVCFRLGMWQLDRREQRRERNAAVARRSALPVVPVADLQGDSGAVRFRRTRVAGIADYGHELVLGSRTRDGSPGVNLLTPIRVPGRDTAFLVNRGWVYSPDAATVDPVRWREADSVAFEGYVEMLAGGAGAPVDARRPRALPRATLASVRARIPYPVAERYVVAQLPPDSARDGVPARLPVPSITDEGPHLGYAVQWFLFGTIAVAGAGIALKAR